MKNNTIIILLLVVIIIILGYLAFLRPKNDNNDFQIPVGDTAYEKDNENSYVNIPKENPYPTTTPATYTYKNHGFTMELPKGYIPHEEQSEGGPTIIITLPDANLNYWLDASWWVKYSLPEFTYVRDEKIGTTTFKVYTYSGQIYYWFKQGNVGYEFTGDIELLKSFKFVGWSQ